MFFERYAHLLGLGEKFERVIHTLANPHFLILISWKDDVGEMPDALLKDIACVTTLSGSSVQFFQCEPFPSLFTFDHSPAKRTGSVVGGSAQRF